MVRVRVEQEEPSTWPAFEGVGLRDTGLVSVIARREVDQTLDDATTAAAALMGLALLDVMEPHSAAVLFAAQTHRPVNRVGRVRAMRDRLWASLERDGLVVPRGVRTEWEVPPSDDELSYVGCVESELADVSALVALTRMVPAVCLVRADGSPMSSVDMNPLVDARESTASLFVAAEAHRSVLGHTLAVRCHGAFDDVDVACDAVGHAPAIAALTAALHTRLGS
jgi:hypothetical protein